MKRFSRILFYLRNQKTSIFLYFLFNILTVLFSMVSLTMLAPFVSMLFSKDTFVDVQPVLSVKPDDILAYMKYILGKLMMEHGQAYALGVLCVIIIVSVFFKNLFTYLSFRVLGPMRNQIMTRLRSDLYTKILQLPIGFFTEQRKGDIISRMSNDANEVEWSVVGTLEGLVRDPINLLILLITLVYISPTLSLFLFVLLGVMGFIIGRVSRSLKKQSTRSQEQLGTLMSILDETLGGLRVIKAFNAEKILGGKFFSTNDKLNHIRNRMNFRRDLASPMSEFLGVLTLSCILWFGGKLVFSGGLDSQNFLTYIVLFTQVITPAKSLSTGFYNIQRGSAAIQRIEEILQAPVAVTDVADPKPIVSFEKSIEFRNVSFAYDEKVILKNINLIIEKGKTVALVGSSGAGKSSLADLVPRFHDVTGGELLIDGVNIKEYSLHSLRSLMGIVTQEPILFNDTIANNIALGMDQVPQQRIEDAAAVANALHFIRQKEDGFDSNIGDRGTKLSGGERQRLTIARAVLKNPPILILDEATSSLDTESERLVQDAINNMMQNRTSLVIAHRLSTIRHADEIIVLQKGEIVERGTHDELLLQNGMYRKLVEMQEVK